MINIVNKAYKIQLPDIKHWFLQRIDIATCYNLEYNEKVREYINNMSLCNYPRRNLKFYQDESLYMTGTMTTLKIYNKMLEFKKHDFKKFANTNFDIKKYLDMISGFIRFECEIKKKKLKDIYNFYTAIIIDGLREVKNRTSKSTYYRNIKELKQANVDFSQKYNITNSIIDFDPFTAEEVL